MSKAKEWGERLENLVSAYEARIAELEQHLAAKGTPDDHEWQPVDAEHPLTAEDDGRMVRCRHGRGNVRMKWIPHIVPVLAAAVSTDESGCSFAAGPANDIVAVLRPKPAPEPRPGEVWESVRVDGGGAIAAACVFSRRELAEVAVQRRGGEVVEFREERGDTAAGALAAAEAKIARLTREIEALRNQTSTHAAAKAFLESADG